MKYANIIGVMVASILLGSCAKKNGSPGNSSPPPTPQSDAALSSFTTPSGVQLPSDTEIEALIQFDVSQYPASGEKSTSLSVATNDVLFIKRPSGAVAVVQFTSFGAFTDSGALTASYRWRYRSAPSQPVLTGTDQVSESYDRKPSADGKGYDVTPKTDHNITVKAGDIWIKWSYHLESSGWLYYYPSRATIQILKSDSFDKVL